MDGGGPVPYELVGGKAHAEAYWEIVQGKVGKDTWDVRFVAGKDGNIIYEKGG